MDRDHRKKNWEKRILSELENRYWLVVIQLDRADFFQELYKAGLEFRFEFILFLIEEQIEFFVFGNLTTLKENSFDKPGQMQTKIKK